MSGDTSSNVGNAALVVSGTGGIVAAVNDYAVVIGLALSAVSIIIGLIFHIRADRWRRQEALENRAALTREIIEQLQRDKKD
jgi:hypothetical protein